MNLGFDVGTNVPTGVAAAHLCVAGVFFYVGSLNAAAGESLGLALNALIGVLILTAGIAAARITARR